MAYPNQQGVGGALAAIAAGLMQAKAGGLRGQAQGLMEREKLDRDAMARALQMAAQARTPEQVGIAQQYMKSMGLDPAAVGLGGSIPETMPPRPLPPVPGMPPPPDPSTVPAPAPPPLGAEPPNPIAAAIARERERESEKEEFETGLKVRRGEVAEERLGLAKKASRLAERKEKRIKAWGKPEYKQQLAAAKPGERRRMRGEAKASMNASLDAYAKAEDPEVREQHLAEAMSARRAWEDAAQPGEKVRAYSEAGMRKRAEDLRARHVTKGLVAGAKAYNPTPNQLKKYAGLAKKAADLKKDKRKMRRLQETEEGRKKIKAIEDAPEKYMATWPASKLERAVIPVQLVLDRIAEGGHYTSRSTKRIVQKLNKHLKGSNVRINTKRAKDLDGLARELVRIGKKMQAARLSFDIPDAYSEGR